MLDDGRRKRNSLVRGGKPEQQIVSRDGLATDLAGDENGCPAQECFLFREKGRYMIPNLLNLSGVDGKFRETAARFDEVMSHDGWTKQIHRLGVGRLPARRKNPCSGMSPLKQDQVSFRRLCPRRKEALKAWKIPIKARWNRVVNSWQDGKGSQRSALAPSEVGFQDRCDTVSRETNRPRKKHVVKASTRLNNLRWRHHEQNFAAR